MSSPDKEKQQFQKPTGEVRGSLRLLRDPVVQLIIGELVAISVVIGALNIHRQPELRLGIIVTALTAGTALAVYEIFRDRKRHQT